ncbi:peptidyl-prolyl cis-trans isomerase C [Bacteriovorax stolpii]|nr:peptidylprolyl isomerase [Bacteriovorax stolpii]TDP53946.1 peptidyl-prolyl cis-trans isomerase C [Bacteriovorax stolpii]
MKTSNYLSILALAFSVSAYAQDKEQPATNPRNTNPEAIVATVNGVEIKKGQLDQAFEQNLMFVSDKIVTKEKVLNDIINREIGIKKAKEAKLQDDPIVKSKMEDVLYHAQISKDLEKKLQGIQVSDKEAQDYYAKNKEYRTAHILFRVRVAPDKAEVEEAMKKSLEVYKQLQSKPQQWPELANKYSQSSTAPAAGDLGYLPAIKYAPEYFRAINGKANGYISPPTRTQFGYHIIKVLGVKEWKEVDPALYKKIVYDQKRDKILEEYFADARKGAKITVNKEWLK